MRNLVVALAVSLDGFIEGPHGEYDWCFTDQDYGLHEFFLRIDAVFIGRKSYEVAREYRDINGRLVPGMPPVTEYVFSSTLQSANEGAVIIAKDAVAEVRKIKALPGKDIWLYGGAVLTNALLHEGLVDEIWMAVHPILLGGGKPLFEPGSQRISLTLLENKTYETGLVSLRYKVNNQGL